MKLPLLVLLLISGARADDNIKASKSIDALGNFIGIRRHSVPAASLFRSKPDAGGDLLMLKDEEGQVPASTNVTAANRTGISAKEEAAVSTSIGIMLLGMVAFTMSLFYMTQFPDPDVQYATWLTLSETMSLLCSVLLFASFKNIMVLQFGEVGGQHNSMPDLKSMIISLLRCLLCFWGVQFLLRKRRNNVSLKAWSSIGGNIIAFAAIDCFGMIQQVPPFRDNPANAFLGMVIAAAMISAMCISAHIVRHYYATLEDGIVKEDDMNWEEACRQVENRFASICIGLLLSIVIRQSITGSLPAIWGSPLNKTQEQVNILFGVSLAFAVPVFVMSMAVSSLEGHRAALPGILRAAHVTQLLLSMSMGWSLVFSGQWEFWSSTHGKGVGLGDKMSSRMIDALLFSYMSFGFIISLDFLADKLKIARTGFDAVSASFVLGLGLSWQGAFTEATASLSNRYEDKHTRAYMDALMTLCLCAIVLPAWVLYMLPRAMAGPQPLDSDKAVGKSAESGESGESSAGEGEADTKPKRSQGQASPEAEATFCTSCGAQFEEEAEFCENCGAKRAPAEEPSKDPAPLARPRASVSDGGGKGRGKDSGARASISEDKQLV